MVYSRLEAEGPKQGLKGLQPSGELRQRGPLVLQTSIEKNRVFEDFECVDSYFCFGKYTYITISVFWDYQNTKE